MADLLAEEPNFDDVLVRDCQIDAIDRLDECVEGIGPNRRSDVVRMSQKGWGIAELAAGLRERVAQDVHRVGLKNEGCPTVGKELHFATKPHKLEFVAE
jgi:hypothetical protein